MDNEDWTFKNKPYDLRLRLFGFACVIARLALFLQTRGRVAIALSEQLLKSGTSAGANYEEADDGSSRRDRSSKRKIVLRELKETSFRLRVMRETDILTAVHDPVITECGELVKIVATLLRKTRPESSRKINSQPSNDPTIQGKSVEPGG
jgi:four helix bundle protein